MVRYRTHYHLEPVTAENPLPLRYETKAEAIAALDTHGWNVRGLGYAKVECLESGRWRIDGQIVKPVRCNLHV